MQFNLNYLKRFEKQIILKKIGVNGQKKLLNSRVLIIGVGGLGCPLLTYLAASGVGTIGIVDHDKVELSIIIHTPHNSFIYLLGQRTGHPQSTWSEVKFAGSI